MKEESFICDKCGGGWIKRELTPEEIANDSLWHWLLYWFFNNWNTHSTMACSLGAVLASAFIGFASWFINHDVQPPVEGRKIMTNVYPMALQFTNGTITAPEGWMFFNLDSHSIWTYYTNGIGERRLIYVGSY